MERSKKIIAAVVATLSVATIATVAVSAKAAVDKKKRINSKKVTNAVLKNCDYTVAKSLFTRNITKKFEEVQVVEEDFGKHECFIVNPKDSEVINKINVFGVKRDEYVLLVLFNEEPGQEILVISAPQDADNEIIVNDVYLSRNLKDETLDIGLEACGKITSFYYAIFDKNKKILFVPRH